MLTENKEENIADITQGLFNPAKTKEKVRESAGFFKSIRTKATALAIAITILPVIAIASIAYFTVKDRVEKEILAEQQFLSRTAMNKIELFMFERYGDIQILAQIVSNLRSAKTPNPQQSKILTDFLKTYGVYDSITVLDANGVKLIDAGAKASANLSNIDYVKAVIKTQKPVVNQPRSSRLKKIYSLFFAAPIFENGKFTGIIRSRVPVTFLSDIVKEFELENTELVLIDQKGIVFYANEKEQLGELAAKDLPVAKELHTAKLGTGVIAADMDDGTVISGYAPWQPTRGLPNVEWGALISTPQDVAFAPVYALRNSFVIGTLITAILVVVIVVIITNRSLKPVLEATAAVQKIGEGKLETRLDVVGDDELATLGSNINILAAQLKALITEQRQETERIEIARQEARAEADASTREQKEAKEFLQRRALELLIEVDPVSRGDLTIRAQVTSDEVGTIADSYNAIIRNLRQIVEQVQIASQSVVQTSQINEEAVRAVAEEYLVQVKDLNAAVVNLGELSQSSQGVSDRALSAQKKVQQASQAVSEGGQAMNRTIEGMSGIQATVTLTAQKVQLLGEASQKISRVVNLISEFTSQTKLLALNAAIEAARAGQEGLGFGVVADEVRTLANQSALATTEIKELVEEIQAQTKSVELAMAEGTDRVAQGTKLVEAVRQKLDEIAVVSTEVNGLVEEIAESSSNQFHTSERVRKSMENVASIAQHTSQESENVAISFGELLHLAEDLQSTVSQFKVN